jgi:hypothetical protein
MSEENVSQLESVNSVSGQISTMPTTLDAIAQRDTGGLQRVVVTTIDISTEAGEEQLQRHLDHDQPKDAKQNEGWYGQAFDCVAITSRAVLSKRDGNGDLLITPKPLIRTTLESSDGRILALASSYVYEDVMGIRSRVKEISAKHPVRVKLRKGGAADRIVRDFDGTKKVAGGKIKSKDA